jgi:cytochrome c oxidase cbb3-type subunit III
MRKPEIDDFTGVETTGHEWDGIKELNKPLPRWWLYSYYACVVWAIGYMIVYPAWPTLTSYTPGIIGYSQRAVVAGEVKAAEAAQGAMRVRLQQTPLKDIKTDPDLLRFAMTAGGVTFQTNCAPCHGRGAQGFIGYPNLNDDDWLWGGSVEDIHATIQYGIRNGDAKARESQMPSYGTDKLLDETQISDAAAYVRSLSGKTGDAAKVANGAAIFKEQCSACHGENGKGQTDLGAPNLTDDIWLYGNSLEAVSYSIRTGRGSAMPSWVGRLDPVTIKALAVYVHNLGGGK